MFRLKKITAAGLAVTMFIPVFGCALKKEEPVDHTGDIIDTAEAFCSAIKSLKIDKAIKVADESLESDLTELKPLLVFEEGDIYNADAALWAEAVAGTIDYVIDEKSAESSEKKAKGTVEVTFTVADQEIISGDESYHEIDYMIEDLPGIDDKEITVTLEISQNDDEDWVVDDYGKLIDELFSFTEVRELDLEIPLSEMIYDIWLTGDGYDEATETFTNTSDIGICVIFGDVAEIDIADMTYTVLYNGEELFTQNVVDYSEEGSEYNNAVIIFVTILDRNVSLTDESYLDAGEYEIVLYNNGEEVCTQSCTVYYDPSMETFDLSSRVNILEISEDLPAEIADDVDQERSGWYNGDELTDGNYAYGTAPIAFRLYVGEDHGEFGYAFYYYESADCPSPIMDNLVILDYGDVPVTVADDGSMYYEFALDGDVAAGYYVAGVYSGPISSSDLHIFNCASVL